MRRLYKKTIIGPAVAVLCSSLTNAAIVSYTATDTTFDAYASGSSTIVYSGDVQSVYTTISSGSWTLSVIEDQWHSSDPFIFGSVALSYNDGSVVSLLRTKVVFERDTQYSDINVYLFAFLEGTGGTTYDSILRPTEGLWRIPETYTQLTSWGGDASFSVHIHAEIVPVPEPATTVTAGLILLPLGAQAFRQLRTRRRAS